MLGFVPLFATTPRRGSGPSRLTRLATRQLRLGTGPQGQADVVTTFSSGSGIIENSGLCVCIYIYIIVYVVHVCT